MERYSLNLIDSWCEVSLDKSGILIDPPTPRRIVVRIIWDREVETEEISLIDTA